MANEPELRPDMSNDPEWVSYLQGLLNIETTGEYDANTEAAVRNAQLASGLPETGICDSATWAALTAEPAVDPGYDPGGGEASALQLVRVWVKAFIPDWVEGAEDGVGAASGVKVIRGPFPGVSDCFYTDNRSYDSDPAASGRVNVDITIDPNTPKVTEKHLYSHATHECDCEDGEIECNETATPTGGVSEARRAGQVVSVDFNGAANNPCHGGSPDADLNGTITIDLAARTVSIHGMVDAFPAYEAYVDIDGGGAQELFTIDPEGGPGSLLGGANRAVSGEVSF
jgi:hypothetical protein